MQNAEFKSLCLHLYLLHLNCWANHCRQSEDISAFSDRITSSSQCKTHLQTHFLLSLARCQRTVTLPWIQSQSAIQPIPPFQQGTTVFKHAHGSKLGKKKTTNPLYISMSPAWFFYAEENSIGTLRFYRSLWTVRLHPPSYLQSDLWSNERAVLTALQKAVKREAGKEPLYDTGITNML